MKPTNARGTVVRPYAERVKRADLESVKCHTCGFTIANVTPDFVGTIQVQCSNRRCSHRWNLITRLKREGA